MAQVVTQNDINAIIDSTKAMVDAVSTLAGVLQGKSMLSIRFIKKKINLLVDALKSVMGLINTISEMDPAKVKAMQASTTALNESINAIVEIIKTLLKAVPLMMIFTIASPIILLCFWITISILNAFLRVIDKIVCTDTSKIESIQETLTSLEESVKAISMVMATLLLSVPLMAIFILASPIIILGTAVSMLVINAVLKITDRLIGVNKAKVKMAENSLEGLESVFGSMASIMAILLLMVPLMAIFVLASPIILICFWLTTMVLKAILSMIFKLTRNPKTMAAITMFIGLIGVLVLVGFAALALYLIAQVVNKAWGQIFLLIGGILLMTVALLGLGALLSWAAPFITPTIAVLSIVPILIGMVLIVALELYILAMIKLDKKAIGNAVNDIMDCAFMVIRAIFESTYKYGGGQEGDPWWKKALAFLGGAVAAIIEVILGVFILALTLVAISLILVMSMMLWALGGITLDKKKISENVKTVIDTALLVIASIFGPKDNPEQQENDRSWIKTVLQVVGGAIANILGAILAVLFLALVFVAILLIDLIATELVILQLIKFDAPKINENVHMVIDTAMMVINAIFMPKENPEEEENDRNWFMTVIEVIGSTFLKLVGAIFAILFLAMTLIAILLIDFIACELLLLQAIKLDQPKITTNVKIVIDTAFAVISAIFDPKQNPQEKENDRSWIEIVFEWVGGTIFRLIGALFAIVFLALTFVAIALVTFIASELAWLQSIDLDAELVKANVGIVIDTAMMVISSIFDPNDDKEDKPSEKGFFRTFMEILGLGPILQLIDAIMSIAFLALIMVSIQLVCCIAKELVYIQNIKLNASKIKQNVKTVISAAHTVIDSVMQGENQKEKRAKGFFRKLLEMVLPSGLLAMIDALMTIGFLALSMTAIGMVGELAMQLTRIANLPSMSNIKSKTKSVMRAAEDVIYAVFNNTGSIWDILEKKEKAEAAERYLGFLKKIPVAVGTVADKLKNMKTITKGQMTPIFETSVLLGKFVDSLQDQAKSDMKVVNTRIRQLNNICDIVDRIGGVSGSDISKSQRIVDNYMQFLNRIDTVNLDNLKTTVSLFEKLSEFSQSINGDFDRLADSLNEKIAPLLEELKELMSDMNVNINTINTNVTTSSDSSGSAAPATGSTATGSATQQRPGSAAPQQQSNKKSQVEKILKDIKDVLTGDNGKRIPVKLG